MDSVFINSAHSKVAYVMPNLAGNLPKKPAKYIYPTYSKAEILSDGLLHIAGVGGSIIAIIALIKYVTGPGSLTDLIAVWIYGIVMILAFIASAAYHMTPWEHLRPTFRRFDHAAIFLKIAGTYTPLVMLIGSHFSYLVLGLVWTVALIGAIRRVFYWTEPGMGSTIMYMGLGWASLALAAPMIQTIPSESFQLVIAGGISYSIGVIFYKWESLKFSNAIWHFFVLAASTSIFCAIYLGEMAKQGQFPA